MNAAIADLNDLMRMKAPLVGPQLRPLCSSVGARDPEDAILGLFSSDKDRRAAAKILRARHASATKAAGGRTCLVVMCDIEFSERTVIVTSLRYVTEIEAILYDPGSVLNLQVEGSDALDTIVSHFLVKNGYTDATAGEFDQVYASAMSIQVIIDAEPNWTTTVRGHVAPVPVGFADALLGDLFDPPGKQKPTAARPTKSKKCKTGA